MHVGPLGALHKGRREDFSRPTRSIMREELHALLVLLSYSAALCLGLHGSEERAQRREGRVEGKVLVGFGCVVVSTR